MLRSIDILGGHVLLSTIVFLKNKSLKSLRLAPATNQTAEISTSIFNYLYQLSSDCHRNGIGSCVQELLTWRGVNKTLHQEPGKASGGKGKEV